ncbi:MAG: BolA/IbaG family iron-sulfur metabolism protein [Proteobacteria bacterium]|nr:BolA/IbaG family iron-sulfur metabolism protein [Pseudomonadota bacterium]
MTSPEKVVDKIKQEIPDAEVEIYELDGKPDHLSVQVTSNAFKGKSLVEQHQMVNKAVYQDLKDATIHALQIKTLSQ